MGKLLILGAGQYGRVAEKIARDCGWTEIEFLDDDSELAVGKLNNIENVEYDGAVVAIGSPDVREQLYKKIKRPATLIHPRAVVYGTVGEGSIVEPNTVIYGTVGRGCVVMSNAVIGHDAIVGDYCQIKYGAVVAENHSVMVKTKVECNEVR